jgi:hypothetical protein
MKQLTIMDFFHKCINCLVFIHKTKTICCKCENERRKERRELNRKQFQGYKNMT